MVSRVFFSFVFPDLSNWNIKDIWSLLRTRLRPNFVSLRNGVYILRTSIKFFCSRPFELEHQRHLVSFEDTFAFKLCASKAVEVVNEEEKDNERQNNNNTNGDDDENDDDRGVVLKHHHHHHHHHHPMLFEYHDAASCKIEYSSKTLR